MGVALERNLPPVTSVVFSGQGEPADNVEALQHAEQILTDPGAFRLSRRRLTLSTIGASSEQIQRIGPLLSHVSWNLQSHDAEMRRTLIPTAEEAPSELRSAFLSMVGGRRGRRTALHVEYMLLKGVTDDVAMVDDLLAFVKPMAEAREVEEFRLVLVPFIPPTAADPSTAGEADLPRPGRLPALPFPLEAPSQEVVEQWKRAVMNKAAIKTLVRLKRHETLV
eukprot:GHVU01123440.1.p1 GENE.GHVU01123440.1~~GHVU01123440.1.p1  ORF type:complete len:223 (-),score=35.34 GHVU01123440.1:1345-2013(-)